MGKRNEPQTRRSLSIDGVTYDLALRMGNADSCSIPQLVTRLIEREAQARQMSKTSLEDIEARRRQDRSPKEAADVSSEDPVTPTTAPTKALPVDGSEQERSIEPVVFEERTGPRAKPLPPEVTPASSGTETRGGGVNQF